MGFSIWKSSRALKFDKRQRRKKISQSLVKTKQLLPKGKNLNSKSSSFLIEDVGDRQFSMEEV